MKREVEFIRTNEELGCDVKLFLEKKVCIEDMKVKLELELKRKDNIRPIKKRYLPSEITERNIAKLNDYGLILDEYEATTVINRIKYMSNFSSKENQKYYHENIGWLELDNGIAFRGSRLIGSNLISNLIEDKFKLSKSGNIKGWLEGINSLILEDGYLALIVVIGFTSVLTKLFNLDNHFGSLVFNLHGGLSSERDIIMRMLNSIWGDPSIEDKGLYKVFNGNIKKVIESINGNEGLSILVKNMDKKGLSNLVNEIQIKHVDSTLVLSSEKEILNPNDIRNIINSDYITEVDLDIYKNDNLKDNISYINKFIRQNYGHAGEKYVEYIFEKGINIVLDEYYLMLENVEMDLNNRKISIGKAAKVAIVLLTATYIKESLKLEINIDQLKDVMLRLEDDIKKEKEKYKLALEDIVDYFNKNKTKYILRKEDIKANSEGLYEFNGEGELEKIIIPNPKFKEIMQGLGYDNISILKVWDDKGIIEHDIGRYDKKIRFGVENPRCVVIKVKDGEMVD